MEHDVKTDARGEICISTLAGKEFNAIYTKQGYLRGGHFHQYDQYCAILSGEFKVTYRRNDTDEVLTKKANDYFVIPATVPHLFEALTDCVFVEWMDHPYESTTYEPYRKLVEDKMRA